MFKYQNCEKDLLKNMEKNLAPKDNKSAKLTKAIELISNASEIFEASGMTKEADKLINLLEKLATNTMGLANFGFEQYGLTAEDFIKMYEGDLKSQLKVNSILKKHLSDDEIAVRLGDKYLEPLQLRRLMREELNRTFEKSKTPKELSFESKLLEESQEKSKRREELRRELEDVVMRKPLSEGGDVSKLAKTNDKVKKSIMQLLKNMESTGTPFAFDGNDLDELDNLEIDDQDMSDINNINIEMSESDFEDED